MAAAIAVLLLQRRAECQAMETLSSMVVVIVVEMNLAFFGGFGPTQLVRSFVRAFAEQPAGLGFTITEEPRGRFST